MAVVLLVFLAPLLATVALVVLAVDGPPILFRHTRVGRFGRPFTLLKFRSMRATAGTNVTVAGDPRVTRCGRVLRRLKLDELPQLWNVLRGDMSLVGPRPEVPEFVAWQREAFRRIGGLRPGLTDWASLAFRDEEVILYGYRTHADFYPLVLLPRKLALARLYRARQSLLLDLRLVVATALLVCGLGGVSRWVAGAALLRRARRGFEPTPTGGP